jgi:hypothetical protein
VLDDLRPLRALAREGAATLAKPLKIFEVPDAYQASYKFPMGMHDFIADNVYMGDNKPDGATFSFVMNPAEASKKTDTVKVEIVAANGEVLRTFRAGGKPGLNRVTWNFGRKGVRFPAQPKPQNPNAPEPGGGQVGPGTYTVRLSYGPHRDSATVRVLPDPRAEYKPEVLAAREKMRDGLMAKVALATEAADQLRAAQQKLGLVTQQLATRDDDKAKEIKKHNKAVGDQLKALLKGITGNDDDIQGIVRRPDALSGQIFEAMSYFRSSEGLPGPTEAAVIARAEAALKKTVDQVNDFFAKDWAAYKNLVNAASLVTFEEVKPLKLAGE